MFWTLVSLFKGLDIDTVSDSNQALARVVSPTKAYNRRRVSFERQSIKELSISSVQTSGRARKGSWVEPEYVPSLEVLSKIMSYLSPEDGAKLILICQFWSGLAAEAFYLSPPIVDADSFPRLTNLLLSPHTIHPYPLLIREFVFKGAACDDLMMGDLKASLEVCVNLSTLRLEGCSHLSNLLAHILKEYTPFLSRIELPGCAVSDSFLLTLIRGVESLRYIDVSYSNISLSTLPILVRECEYLETLDMTGCPPALNEFSTNYEASEYYIVGEMLKDHKNNTLRQLIVSNTDITDSMISYVCRHCTKLDSLELDSCMQLTDAAVNSIAMHTPKIESLNLSYCHITDLALQSLAIHLSVQSKKAPKQRPASYSSFSEFQKSQPLMRNKGIIPLSTLILTGCPNITAQGIILLASKCPLLKNVVLDGCEQITNWYYEQKENTFAVYVERVPVRNDDDVDNESSSFKPGFRLSRPLSVSRKDLLARNSVQHQNIAS